MGLLTNSDVELDYGELESDISTRIPAAAFSMHPCFGDMDVNVCFILT